MKGVRRFVWSAVLLSAVQLLTRVVSVSFNAWISARVGAEGMGLYTLVMSVYGFAVTVAVSGVHLASVRLTAQALAAKGSARKVRAVVRGCVAYSLLFGVGAGGVLLAVSGPVGRSPSAPR